MKNFQKWLFHPFIEEEGACYFEDPVDRDGQVGREKEPCADIDGRNCAQHDHVKQIDGIGSVAEQEDERMSKEDCARPGFFEEDAAGDDEGGG